MAEEAAVEGEAPKSKKPLIMAILAILVSIILMGGPQAVIPARAAGTSGSSMKPIGRMRRWKPCPRSSILQRLS